VKVELQVLEVEARLEVEMVILVIELMVV